MNRLLSIAAASALLVFGAAAQDPEAIAKKKAEADAMVRVKMIGAVKGTAVKGAPYSAEEISETNQTLADGTRIHRETKTTVYRDSEGRTRHESPDNITITDPIANVTYILDPKAMTGQKLAMAAGNFTFVRTASSGAAAGGPATATFTMTSDGPAHMIVNGEPLDDRTVAEAIAKAKASGSPQTFTYEKREVFTSSGSGSGAGTGIGVATAPVGGDISGPVRRMASAGSGASEYLGKQTIEGVEAEGRREVFTLAAGAIGNDRPIQVSTESWYSAELKMNVMTKHSDPRTGDETFRLTNVSRGEPAAYLFQSPAGYQITERK